MANCEGGVGCFLGLPSMSTVTGRTSVWFVIVDSYAAEPTAVFILFF